MGNVVDLKTGKAIFPGKIRNQLEEGIQPHLQDGKDASQVVNTVEQIICTALVSAAVAAATSLATKLANKITKR